MGVCLLSFFQGSLEGLHIQAFPRLLPAAPLGPVLDTCQGPPLYLGPPLEIRAIPQSSEAAERAQSRILPGHVAWKGSSPSISAVVILTPQKLPNVLQCSFVCINLRSGGAIEPFMTLI